MENYHRNKDASEGGYIVVETVGAFSLFVLLIVSILSLVNISAVQARVHFALTQTAKVMSMYSYTLEVLGVSRDLAALDRNAQVVSGEVNAMISDINSVIATLDSMEGASGAAAAAEAGGNAAVRAAGWAGDAAADPKNALKLMMNYGVSEFTGMILEQLARPLVGGYLSNAGMSGNAYLTAAGVVNKSTGRVGLGALEFHRFSNLGVGNSVLIDSDGNVKLVVEYEILYTFAGLPLPFRPTLRVTQTVVTKAWLGGSGRGYSK